MTDDQLARELERRSESASLGHAWARDDLLPAVNSAIDTRPQRVATSRGPALAGLTGVVAILLVLVVAIPRLAPGPSTTPSASPTPAVMDAAAFATRFAAGELNGQTVVVDGRIQPYEGQDILYGTLCGREPDAGASKPGGDCTLGRLDAVESPIWVSAPYLETVDSQRPQLAQPGDWSWRAAQPPVEGRLVLSVSTAGFVEFLGTVLPSSPEAISVAAANQVSIDRLSPTDVALVKGWLWSPESGGQITIDCVLPPFSPVPGLPNDYCQPHDALLDASFPQGESITPPEPRLRVQRSAARRYGLDDDQPHVFALAPRLYGGGCAGQPPCLHWEVVGRLTDSPDQTTPQSPEPSATPESGVMETSEFAIRLAAGELNGQTVLVNGRIGLDLRFGRYCAPTDLCYLGPLEGAEVDVFAHGTPSTEGGDASQVAGAAWPWWQPFVAPIEGTLVLSVSESGAVEYMGRARPSATSITWHAADAALLDVNTLALDEVVVIDGWLTGNLLIPPCAAPAEGTYIGSLPGRWCGGPDWVLDQPASFTPGSQLPEGGIAVQDGAYEAFAPNPTQGAMVGEPRAADYLLSRRLEGGGCPNDAPPCWQWEVVGRLSDAQSSPSIPTPSTAIPTLSPEPTPAPVDLHGATAMHCAGSDRSVLVLDTSRTATSCADIPGGGHSGPSNGLSLGNPSGDESILEVRWNTSGCVTHVVAAFSQQTGSNLLEISQSDIGCFGPATAIGFTVQFNSPVPAETVQVEFGRLNVDGEQTVTEAGLFDLVVFARAGQVSDGHPIEDLDAYLTFIGDQPVVVTGSGMGLSAPMVQQLGGDLAAGAAMSADCARYKLIPGEPIEIPFETTGVLTSSNRKHPEFRPITADKRLVLPPGDWVLSMNENFVVGECGSDNGVSSAALIIVRVR